MISMEYTVFEIIKQMGITPGMAVISLKGHDKGRIYLVIQNEGSFVKLADGRLRGLGKQKKKRNSHVKTLGQAAEPDIIGQLYKLDEDDANANIRMIIEKFLSMN